MVCNEPIFDLVCPRTNQSQPSRDSHDPPQSPSFTNALFREVTLEPPVDKEEGLRMQERDKCIVEVRSGWLLRARGRNEGLNA